MSYVCTEVLIACFATRGKFEADSNIPLESRLCIRNALTVCRVQKKAVSRVNLRVNRRGECVSERSPAGTLSNGRRVPVWPAWDTAYGRSRCAGRNSLSLSSLWLLLLFFRKRSFWPTKNRCSIFLLDERSHNFLRRRRVNAPYVKSVKIRALANRTINFFLWLVNFLGPPSGPEESHRWEVNHGWLRIYSRSRISMIWSRNFSDVWGVLDVPLSKSVFHRKVGQCSTSAIRIAIEGREGTRRTTPKLPGWTFPGVPAVPKRRGWFDKEFAEYEIAAIVSAAITRGAILSTSDPFTILVIRPKVLGEHWRFVRVSKRIAKEARHRQTSPYRGSQRCATLDLPQCARSRR